DVAFTAGCDTTRVANGSYTLYASGSYIDALCESEPAPPAIYTLSLHDALPISSVSDGPDSFSPNGDGQYDTTTIYYTLSKQATVTRKSTRLNNRHDQTLDSGSRNADTQAEAWDGKGDNGQVVPDGVYTYTVAAA